MDFTTITAAVDFTDVMTGLGVVAVAISGVLIAIRGSKILLRFMAS